MLFYAVLADQVYAREEEAVLRAALSRMRMSQDPRSVDRVLDRATKVFKARGPEGLLESSSEAVPGDLRATCFALATDLVLADGHVAEAEEACLGRIQRALEVPDAVADKLVEAMVIKNRG